MYSSSVPFPRVAVGRAPHHARLAHSGVGYDPNNTQLCAIFTELRAQILNVRRVANFPRERRVDEHGVRITQRLKRKVQDRLVLVVADVRFKNAELRSYGLPATLKICLESGISVSLSK